MSSPQSDNRSHMGLAEKLGLKYFAFLINLVIYVGAFQFTKSMEFCLLAIIFLPRIGTLLPNDEAPKQNNSNEYNKNWYHMMAPIGSVVQLFVIIYYTWAKYGQFNHSYQSLISSFLAVGVAASQTIDASHELLHRNEKIFQLIGFVGLIPFQFTTYPIQHLYMHHKHVGTPEDDITAPKNTPYLVYFFRSVFSSYRQTFKYSKTFFAFCITLHFTYFFMLYQIALKQFAGNQELALKKVGYFFGFALSSLFVMESIQYIEHYGLVYRKNNQEKTVLEISSWNTTINPVYNWSVFRFQRHSDHHMNAYKVYSSLQLNQKMPLYPFTFPEAISASWIPAIWYKIADHLVDRVINQEKITKEDIKKSKNWMLVSNLLSGLILITNFYTAAANKSQGSVLTLA